MSTLLTTGSPLRRALRIWVTAFTHPRRALNDPTTDEERLSAALWILVLFSLLYTATAAIFAGVGRLPAIAPWMPIPAEQYYFYQVFWTVPWGLATGILMAGLAHVIGVVGRHSESGAASFEAALLVISTAWVIPSFVLMWLPETFLAPFVAGRGLPWPAWVEVLRLSVLAPIWQTALTAIGLRETHQVGWVHAVFIGVLTTAVSFVMFLPFMR